MLSMVSQRGVSAQTTDPVAVVDAYRVATGHDVEAALALVADDATFTTVPPPPGTPGKWTGKEQIRQLLEFTVVMNAVHERVGSATVDGDKVTMTVMILNNNFRKWGIGAVEHTYEAVVQGGKIKSLITTMSPSERPRVAAASQAYEQAQAGQPPAGMPRTGGEQPVPLSLLVAFGMVAALIGLDLRRRAKPHID